MNASSIKFVTCFHCQNLALYTVAYFSCKTHYYILILIWIGLATATVLCIATVPLKCNVSLVQKHFQVTSVCRVQLKTLFCIAIAQKSRFKGHNVKVHHRIQLCIANWGVTGQQWFKLHMQGIKFYEASAYAIDTYVTMLTSVNKH